jgi:hypothetical protein
MQPDIANLDLALLSERVSAHVVAAVALEDQIEIMRVAVGDKRCRRSAFGSAKLLRVGRFAP